MEDNSKELWIDFPWGSYAWMREREQGEPYTDEPKVLACGSTIEFAHKGNRVTFRDNSVCLPREFFETSDIVPHLEKRGMRMAREILAPVDDLIEGPITALVKNRDMTQRVNISLYDSGKQGVDHLYAVEMFGDLRKIPEQYNHIKPREVLKRFRGVPEGYAAPGLEWLSQLAEHFVIPDKRIEGAEFLSYDLREALTNALEFYEHTPALRAYGKAWEIYE